MTVSRPSISSAFWRPVPHLAMGTDGKRTPAHGAPPCHAGRDQRGRIGKDRASHLEASRIVDRRMGHCLSV